MAKEKTSYPNRAMTIEAAGTVTINSFVNYAGTLPSAYGKVAGVALDGYTSGDLMAIYKGVCLVEGAGTFAIGDKVVTDAEGHALKAMEQSFNIVKAANQAVTSATLADDDDFTFEALPNTTMRVRFELGIKNAKAGALGIKYKLVVPSGATAIAQKYEANAKADTLDFIDEGLDATGGTDTILIDASEEGIGILDCYVTVGATGGTVKLQWAQSTSDAAAVSLMKGSSMSVIVETPINIAGVAMSAGTDGTLAMIDLGQLD